MDNYFKSIVCISPNEDIDFPDEMKEKIKKNIIELPGISVNDAIKIAKERLGKNEILSTEMIKKIYKISGSNPRRFLANCEDVCRNAIESGRNTVTSEDLKVL